MTQEREKNERTMIGSGEMGGKAQGLLLLSRLLEQNRQRLDYPNLKIYVPPFWVLRTGIFEQFLKENQLEKALQENLTENQLARYFLNSALPASVCGEIWRMVTELRTPLAIRSSSLLEDRLSTPFAGVYSTKMIPNLHSEKSIRFRQAASAVKWIFASTFFPDALRYRDSLDLSDDAEAMAVIVQLVEGQSFFHRFYPNLSGVARSVNLYPFGDGSPRDGMISLALGLGKTIVDGSPTWTYNPRSPKSPPPFASAVDRLKNSQHRFWAVDMRGVHPYNPYVDHEYMTQCNLQQAEQDLSLSLVSSTYDSQNDRILPGIAQPGPRVIDFAPLLEYDALPINEALLQLLELGEAHYRTAVEIEFAASLSTPGSRVPSRLGVLQIRPMKEARELPPFCADSLHIPLVESHRCLGGGEYAPVTDLIAMNDPDLTHSRRCAQELSRLNQDLAAAKRPYLLLGYGRWGSSDPWLGVPINWSQISAARGIVEISPPERGIEFSQGSHFFHNLINLDIPYLFIPSSQQNRVDWEWIRKQEIVSKGEHITHYRTAAGVRIRVDGINQHGVVYHGNQS